MATGKDDRSLGPCPLCGREMIDGPSVNRHHWVPRGHGGGEWSVLHVICHKKIHSVLTDRELAAAYATPEALRTHPEIAEYIRWVRRRPAQYMNRHDRRRDSSL